MTAPIELNDELGLPLDTALGHATLVTHGERYLNVDAICCGHTRRKNDVGVGHHDEWMYRRNGLRQTLNDID